MLGHALPDESWAVRGRIGLLGHEPLLYRELTRAREPRLPRLAARRRRRRAPSELLARGRHGAAAPTSRCARSRAGWSSASRSAVRCCTTRSCCCWTSRARTSIPAAERAGRAADRARLRAHPGDRQPRPGRRARGGRPRARPGARPRGAAEPAPPSARPRRELPASACAGELLRGERRAAPTPRAPGVAGRGALLRKELRVELRTFESVPAMSLFSVTTYVLLPLRAAADTRQRHLASGVLWVTLLFAAVLGVNRLFVADAEQGGFDGFLLSPGRPQRAAGGQGARAASSTWSSLELVAVPAFALLLLGVVAGAGDARAAGRARARRPRRRRDRHARRRARRAHARARPARAAAVAAAARAGRDRRRAGDHAAARRRPRRRCRVRWLLSLALYDLVFAVIAFALFDFLLED